MGFNIYFYETRDDVSRERLAEMLNELYREQEQAVANCQKLQRKIKAIERERDKYVLVYPQPKLVIYNLTYNYSTPECIEYWYGRRDFHGKTVKDAREIMLTAINRMEEDGIVPNDLKNYVRPTRETMLSDLLMWLKLNYPAMMNMNGDWVVMLD